MIRRLSAQCGRRSSLPPPAQPAPRGSAGTARPSPPCPLQPLAWPVSVRASLRGFPWRHGRGGSRSPRRPLRGRRAAPADRLPFRGDVDDPQPGALARPAAPGWSASAAAGTSVLASASSYSSMASASASRGGCQRPVPRSPLATMGNFTAVPPFAPDGGVDPAAGSSMQAGVRAVPVALAWRAGEGEAPGSALHRISTPSPLDVRPCLVCWTSWTTSGG